ncbi:MAG: ion transporter [Chitinophagales bacterium]
MLKKFFFSDKIIFTAIAMNAIVIFLLAFPDISYRNLLMQFDKFFILLFLLEAIVKLYILKPKAYFNNSWHAFDFGIVMSSLPTLFLPMGSSFSFILIFRTFRLFRLIKLFEFIPNLKHLIVGLIRALKASVFVLIALFGYNLILSILTAHLFGNIVPQYFANPLTSCYTIFQLFTLEGWAEIPQTIIEADTFSAVEVGFIRLYFVLIVCSGGIFGISLANAIFVDEMTMDNNLNLERKIDKLSEKIEKLQLQLQQNKHE